MANTDYAASDSVSHRLETDSFTNLLLEAVNGSVEISSSAHPDSVIIWSELIVQSESVEDAEAHLLLLSVEVTDHLDQLIVRTLQPQQAHGRNYIVNYRIHTPATWPLFIEQANGDIAVSSTENFVQAASANGVIHFEDIHGNVIATLANGGIDCQVYLSGAGACLLTVANGWIELSIPQATSAEFSSQVTTGSITIDNLSLQNQHTTPTSVTGTLGAGDATINLEVANGTIYVSGF